MFNPEDVLAKISAATPGTTITSREVHPGVVVHTLAADGTPLLRVVEDADRPLMVEQFHVNSSSSTTWAWCGKGFDPNRPRITDNPETRLTSAEWDEMEDQKKHTRIDTAEKLQALCRDLLATPDAARLVALAKRKAKWTAK